MRQDADDGMVVDSIDRGAGGKQLQGGSSRRQKVEAGRQGPAHGAHEIRDSIAFSQRLFRESRPRPVPESTIGLNSLRSAEKEKAFVQQDFV